MLLYCYVRYGMAPNLGISYLQWESHAELPPVSADSSHLVFGALGRIVGQRSSTRVYYTGANVNSAVYSNRTESNPEKDTVQGQCPLRGPLQASCNDACHYKCNHNCSVQLLDTLNNKRQVILG